MDEFLAEIDEDVEGMQSMMYLLQQQLKESKEQTAQLKEENKQLKVSLSKISPPESAATSCNLLSSPQPVQEIMASSSGDCQMASSPVNTPAQSAKNITTHKLQSTDDITKRDTSFSPSLTNNEKVNSNGTVHSIPLSETGTIGTNLTSEECSQTQDIDSENHEHPQTEKCESLVKYSSNSLLPPFDTAATAASSEMIASIDAEEGLAGIASSPSETHNHFPPSDNSDVSNEPWSPKNQPNAESADEERTETDQCLVDAVAATPAVEGSDANNWTSNKNTSIIVNNGSNDNSSSASLPINNGTMAAAISEVEIDD